MTASSPSAARAAVDQLEGLLAKATPGPWGMDPDHVGGFDLVDEDGQFIADRLGSIDRDNAAAIVGLRNLAPHLLAAVKAVDELADQCEREHDKCVDHDDLRVHIAATALGNIAKRIRTALAFAAVDVTETADGAS